MHSLAFTVYHRYFSLRLTFWPSPGLQCNSNSAAGTNHSHGTNKKAVETQVFTHFFQVHVPFFWKSFYPLFIFMSNKIFWRSISTVPAAFTVQALY